LRLAAQLVLVLAGSMLLAASAQFKMVIPFSPVPVTGQTLVVLMIGLAFVFGVQPFLWGDAIKLVVAACLMPVAWRAVKAMTGTSCNDRG
jgi:biotin transporter BioY